MTLIHGFEFIRETTVPELNTRARLYRHARTGAELLSLENDDENKVFGITFRTPPADSTGLPHILEHVVLAGSEKYPLKDPFFEMVKGSLATYINAMTFPDKTVYPAASTNLQDFYNLLDVYADAVFHPLMTPEKLAQEGWHYELDAADGPLTFKGVVFNEMKGAYSSPDNLLDRTSRRALFPDTTYGVDSGGDPAVIPDLTYEQFRAFYQAYYHPSNALLYFYGDDDPQERLRRMDAYLAPFERAAVDSAVALQPVFDAPRQVRHPYSANGDGDGAAPRAFVEVNWLLPEYDDPALVMALSVLSDCLVDTPASPLRKTLIDSGLGEEVLGGFSTYTRQTTFSAGLKGVAVADAGKVEPLILDTLAQLAGEGIDPAMIAAAVNTIEFQLRENNTGRAPRGLALLLRALSTWLHGRDPLAPLAFEAPLAAFKDALAADPAYLSGLIRRYLLDNPHRVTVILEPDADLARRQEAAEAERLAAARAALSPDEAGAVMERAAELRRRQETPDPPEVVALLPSLRRADLEPRHKPIPLETEFLRSNSVSIPILYHDLFTNGIVYLDLGLDLSALPADLLPFAPLFGRALVEMGTAAEDFVRLSQRIGRTTGGIYPTTLVVPVRQGPGTRGQGPGEERSSLEPGGGPLATYLMLRGKATTAQAPAMLDILRDVLLTVRLDNQERFRQMVLEAKAGAEAQLSPAGHIVANTRLRAHLHPAFAIEETLSGVSQLLFLRRLAEEVDSDWPGVLARLERTRAALVNRAGVIANVTVDEAGYGALAPTLEAFLAELPIEAQGRRGAGAQGGEETSADASFSPAPLLPRAPAQLPPREGLSFPSAVNYVAKGANLYDLGYSRHGSMAVITNLLRSDYLLQKVRIQGGAYGAFATFSPNAGALTFLSYRDPNLSGTLRAYDGVAGFLRGIELSDAALTPAIVGAIGAIDAYQLPDAKGYTSLARYLANETDESLQAYRDQVLGTTVADFHALGDTLEQFNAAADVVVLGSPEALAAANGEGLGLEITKVM